MKLLALLILISSSLTSLSQTIKPLNVDFKTISAPTTREVVIVNNTAKPMVISAIKGDCNCVSVQFAKSPIRIGDSTTIKVTYRPKRGESGLFYKVMRIEYGAKKTPTEFTLRGVVKQ